MLRKVLRMAMLGLGMSILAASMAIAKANAQVKPGDVITPENAAKVQSLVSPGVYYMVQHGMQMNIVPTERVEWPPPYMDATEKYSSQVQPDGGPSQHDRLCRRPAFPADRR